MISFAWVELVEFGGQELVAQVAHLEAGAGHPRLPSSQQIVFLVQPQFECGFALLVTRNPTEVMNLSLDLFAPSSGVTVGCEGEVGAGLADGAFPDSRR